MLVLARLLSSSAFQFCSETPVFKEYIRIEWLRGSGVCSMIDFCRNRFQYFLGSSTRVWDEQVFRSRSPASCIVANSSSVSALCATSTSLLLTLHSTGGCIPRDPLPGSLHPRTQARFFLPKKPPNRTALVLGAIRGIAAPLKLEI